MIRIREIALPPEHSVAQLSFEAAKLLKVSNSKIRRVKIVKRSVDARKKPDVRIVYTVDVQVEGNENKIHGRWYFSVTRDATIRSSKRIFFIYVSRASRSR